MSTQAKRITEFRVNWEAEHEQYYQGHGIADQSHYTDCATGCGSTLREAFEDALEQLTDCPIDKLEVDVMLVELTSQVKDHEMLDWSIEEPRCGYCMAESMGECQDNPKHQEDCAVCAGEWHYYVNIDVKVE